MYTLNPTPLLLVLGRGVPWWGKAFAHWLQFCGSCFVTVNSCLQWRKFCPDQYKFSWLTSTAVEGASFASIMAFLCTFLLPHKFSLFWFHDIYNVLSWINMLNELLNTCSLFNPYGRGFYLYKHSFILKDRVSEFQVLGKRSIGFTHQMGAMAQGWARWKPGALSVLQVSCGCRSPSTCPSPGIVVGSWRWSNWDSSY